MSTVVKFVEPEHEAILRQYLDGKNVTLVFGKELQDALDAKDLGDGEEIDYEASTLYSDVIVEMAESKDHPAMLAALEPLTE